MNNPAISGQHEFRALTSFPQYRGNSEDKTDTNEPSTK